MIFRLRGGSVLLPAGLMISVIAAMLGLGQAAVAQPVENWRIPEADLPRILLSDAERERARSSLVGIVTGAPGGVYAQLGNDLMRLLNDRGQQTLRVAPILGQGSVNNLADLRHLPRVDFGIVQSDVLEVYERTEAGRELRSSIRYVTRLHNEFLHILSRRDIVGDEPASVCKLANRRINVAGVRSGTAITVRTVLNGILGLGMSLDSSDSTEEGIEQLRAGRVDSVAFVVGKPAPIFKQQDRRDFMESRFVFVSVPIALLQEGCGRRPASELSGRSPYEAAQIIEADYPGLVAQDRPVETIAIPAVLAAYAWPSSSGRSQAASEFVRRFFALATDPRNGLGRPNGGFSPQWCGIDLARDVKNWKRYEAAEVMLREHSGASFVIRCGGARLASCSDPNLLQTEFAAWYARQFPSQSASGASYISAYEAYRRDNCG